MASAVSAPLALFPLIYCVVGYVDRYRNPIHWMVLMLAGAALWRAPKGSTARLE